MRPIRYPLPAQTMAQRIAEEMHFSGKTESDARAKLEWMDRREAERKAEQQERRAVRLGRASRLRKPYVPLDPADVRRWVDWQPPPPGDRDACRDGESAAEHEWRLTCDEYDRRGRD